jgi:transcriptional regulator with XRE-family HTH domain
MSNVAVAVKELRETLGLTQEQLSLRAGFPGGSRVYVAKIETGRNELSTIAARERVAKGFALTRLLEIYKADGEVPEAADAQFDAGFASRGGMQG